jgi:hypothetical protein
MSIRYLTIVFVTSLVLSPGNAPGAAPHCGADLRAFYSPRALRHMRTLLQLRLYEERRRRLQQLVQMLARHASVDEMLRLPDDAAALSQGTQPKQMKHLSLPAATTCW